MVDKIMGPIVKAGGQLVAYTAGVVAKETMKKGLKYGGYFALLIISNIITSMVTSKWKDKVFAEFLKKHDKEQAQKLTEQFKLEMNDLKKQIAALKLEKEEAKKRCRDGIIALCEKYGIDSNAILK